MHSEYLLSHNSMQITNKHNTQTQRGQTDSLHVNNDVYCAEADQTGED